MSDKNKLIEELKGYLSISDWDERNGLPPSRKAVQDAIAFIEKLSDNLLMPEIALNGNGEVGLILDDGNVYFEADFEGNGAFSYSSVDADGHEHGADNYSVKARIPQPILTCLKDNS